MASKFTAGKPLRIKIKDGLFGSLIPGTKFSMARRESRSQDPCVYCGGPSDTDEHVIPKSEGGQSCDNIVGACRVCNNARSSTPLLHYLLSKQK